MAPSSRSRGRHRHAALLAFISLLAISMPSSAGASEIVRFKAGFSPDRLGVSTTVHLQFNISSTTSDIPSPVTNVKIDLPSGMGLGTTDLGEATCEPEALFTFGPLGCSPNSRMGIGNATVALPLGPEPIDLSAAVTLYMAVPQNQHTTLLLYAETKTPVYSQHVFPTELLPPSGNSYGAELNTAMPLIPTVPEGGPAVIVHMETSLGPNHLTYYKRTHGKVVPYSPEGLAVPERCPRGGFPFRAIYKFNDGSTVATTARVPCPPRAAVGTGRMTGHGRGREM
jgi:hypothetical protein